MSFIDLTKNDAWSEADIINRTEAMITSEFPKTRVDILTRKMQGQAMGYVLTEQEESDLVAYSMACYHAGAAADAARADMLLLAQVMELEAAYARLALPAMNHDTTPVTDESGVVTDFRSPEATADMNERLQAGLTVGAAQMLPEVLALYTLRNPVPEPVETLDEVVGVPL